MTVERGYKVEQGSGELLQFSGAQVLVKASSESTGGAFTVVEEIAPLDTPLHVHEREDEWWYIVEGEHVVQVGEDEFRVGPGDTVFGPRGVPHAQRRVVPRVGRTLEFFSPGGFDGFFRELAEAERTGASMPQVYADVSAKFGVVWL